MRWSALLLLAVALSGCGENREVDDAEWYRVVWRPSAPVQRLPDRPPLSVSVDDPAVLVGAAHSDVLQDAATRGPMLVANDPARISLRFPLQFDPRAFNRLALSLSARQQVSLVGALMQGSTVLVETKPIEVDAGSDHTRVFVDWPSGLVTAEAGDGLRLVLRGDSLEIALHSVELVAASIAERLPDPDGEPQLVDLGRDQRRGIGLLSDRPLKAVLHAAPGAELAFSCGVPLLVRDRGPEVCVEVELVQGHRKQTSRTALGYGSWTEVRIPLADFAGDELEAWLRLDAGGRDARDLAGCAIANARVTTPRSKTPSVLFVTSDTHRADHVGSASVRTPTLERLAARGIFFEDCLSTTNITNPAHVALMTGLGPRDTRIVDNQTLLADEAVTLAERFRDQGYLTLASVSARHLELSGLTQGFDRFCAPGIQRPAAETIDVVEAWLRDAKDEPLFLWVHVFDAHTPYAPPAGFAEPYYDASKDPFDPALPLPEIGASAGVMPAGLRDLDWMRALYKGEVAYLDAQLARLFEHPRLREGIVAFTADHGECLGEHDIYWGHDGLFPENLRVPLILAWPGCDGGRREPRPVSSGDIGRTLLELAKLDAADHCGTSLLASRAAEPEPRFTIAGNGGLAAMTHAGWHLILWLDVDKARRHTIQLYDLNADPGCTRDRAVDDHERALSMRQSLVAWLLDADRTVWAAGRSTLDPAELAALGYTGGESRAAGPWFDPHCTCAACAALE